MKKLLLAFCLIFSVSLVFISSKDVDASDFCKEHWNKRRDSSSSQFDSYSGQDIPAAPPFMNYVSAYSARQDRYYSVTFKLTGGRTWYGQKRNKGVTSGLKIVPATKAWHTHCTYKY